MILIFDFIHELVMKYSAMQFLTVFCTPQYLYLLLSNLNCTECSVILYLLLIYLFSIYAIHYLFANNVCYRSLFILDQCFT